MHMQYARHLNIGPATTVIVAEP